MAPTGGASDGPKKVARTPLLKAKAWNPAAPWTCAGLQVSAGSCVEPALVLLSTAVSGYVFKRKLSQQ